MRRSRWRLADLREALPFLAPYSLPGLSKALRRLSVRRGRGRLKLHSPDLAYRAKLAWISRALALLEESPGGVRLFYADEFSLYRQPSLGLVYWPSGEEPAARLSLKANTRYRIAACLEASSGRVLYRGGSKAGVDLLCRLLESLREGCPTERIFLVWDNWPVHQHPRVLQRAAELAIEVLWLPTYAPWTNPIEKLWRMLKQELLHHHRLADRWEELKARVRAFLQGFSTGSPDLLRYVGLLPD